MTMHASFARALEPLQNHFRMALGALIIKARLGDFQESLHSWAANHAALI